MKYKTYSPEHETKRLTWPKGVPRRCPICGAKVHFVGADAGMIVHALEGPINQVVNMYVCRNPACRLHRHWFNPNPRFNYGGRHFGADVIRFVAHELLSLKSKPGPICDRLTKDHGVRISLRTVERMCDDALNLKAYQVDQKTRQMLAEDPNVLLGFDCEETSGTWLFLDLLRNRVLHTCTLPFADHEALHAALEGMQAALGITFVGWVSDKQPSIVTCHDLYYPAVPHQYCEFHFLRNTWRHAEALDSNVFMPLQKAANALCIHKVSPSATAEFEGKGRLSIREVFKDVDRDLRTMLKARNVAFKQLRGTTLYAQFRSYTTKMRAVLPRMDPKFRITKIHRRTVEELETALEEVRPRYEEACLLRDFFAEVRQALADPGRYWLEQQQDLDNIYARVWATAREKGLDKDLGSLTTFQPGKNTDVAAILGEWCRLYAAYLPGLFQYVHFPIPVRTNDACEESFSVQKQTIYGRVAKKLVAHILNTRGEAYLRVTHCTEEELNEDILTGVTTCLLKRLQLAQQQRIGVNTQDWNWGDRELGGYCDYLAKFYPGWEDIKTEETLG